MHVVSPVHVAEGQTDPVIANESKVQYAVDTIPSQPSSTTPYPISSDRYRIFLIFVAELQHLYHLQCIGCPGIFFNSMF